MALEVTCPGCSRRLSVPESAADQQIRCPSCAHVFTFAEINPFSPQSSGAGFPQPPIPPPEATEMWYVHTPDGQQFGPVSKLELDQWAAQGRLRADFELIRAGGTSVWRKAVQIYPALASGPNSSYPTTPNASRPSGQPINPYSSPNSPFSMPQGGRYVPQGGQYLVPHRGVLILVLGIIAFPLCLLCPLPGAICGGIAWAMGAKDLKQIRNGYMDPAGEGLTRAGMILGIIMSLLVCIGILFVIAIIATAPHR